MSLVIDRLNEEKERSPCLEAQDSIAEKMFGAQRRIALDVLLVCWGLGTWLGVNGLFVQLPLLVERLPEQWALPSSMTVAIQCANIGLLIYASIRKVTRISDALCIYGLLAIGTTALFLNAFLYSETAVIGGTERSMAFLILTFFVALVGCTSSVLFYPYLRHYREMYLATYLVGEGLSGFIPSILALIQGIGGEPECVLSADNSTMTAVYPPARFNSMVFIILLGMLSALSLTSFCVLHNYSGFSSERVKESAAAKEEEATLPRESLYRAKWVGLMALMASLNALFNGVMPSVQSYSCMPYGTRTYHLSVTLGAMANPVACLAGVWLRPPPARWLGAALALAAALLAYILATAVTSPAPPLYTHTGGAVLVVFCWVLASGLISYARMWVYGWARRGGARGMRVCGAVGQAGSAIGSLALFIIVNYTNVFQQAQVCHNNI
ncbi:solute carrier family 52, riboflavin transporter, member 3-A isoform X1 [Colias croceus]|uniref:solute carrier family 52, riboflavin transporter, member 3-A isoform X1 n=1 Tax=Colias crocea TaxID=72248 RepID=UPI001E27D143|nr:solute carrier family 52, riboflavin transporter, member 3-A isoform X1 [Colias croceus]